MYNDLVSRNSQTEKYFLQSLINCVSIKNSRTEQSEISEKLSDHKILKSFSSLLALMSFV